MASYFYPDAPTDAQHKYSLDLKRRFCSPRRKKTETPDEFLERKSVLAKTLKKKMISSLHIKQPFKKYDNVSLDNECFLLDGYAFKKSCGGKVCCQAINKTGERCRRPAAIVPLDFTESIPQISKATGKILRKYLGAMADSVIDNSTKQLQAITSNTCCFFCWQHASTNMLEALTVVTNVSYYVTHPEDILSIFFKNVQCKKHVGNISLYPDCTVGEWKSLDEVLKGIVKTDAIMMGLIKRSADGSMGLNTYSIGIRVLVWFYDTLKPILMKFLTQFGRHASQTVDKILARAALLLSTADSKTFLPGRKLARSFAEI